MNKLVNVSIDRPLGSYHPKYKNLYYPINYGYVEGILAPDGDEQDVYILGVEVPLSKFTGKIIAVIKRKDDVEDKWVACPEGLNFSKNEIEKLVHFQEQFFDSEIIIINEEEKGISHGF